jgi:predicted Zn finger-like uncharacterized protein
LFTQCSKCETVFKLSAEVLRAAGGQVRCGNCGEVFNALARLAEDANAFAPRESSYDLESRADSILREPSPPHPAPEPDTNDDFGTPGVEIARLQILDWNESDAEQPITEDIDLEQGETESDPSLEFTLPPGELDRIFIESKKKQAAKISPTASPPDEPEEFEVDITPVPVPAKPVPAAAKPVTPVTPVRAAPVVPTPVAPTPVAPAPIAPVPVAPTPAARKPALAPPPVQPAAAAKARIPAAAAVEAPQSAPELPPHPEAVAGPTSSAFDVPDAVRFEILSGMESAQPLHELSQSIRTPGLKRWMGAAIVFALLLAFQIVHHNREYLVAHGPFAGLLRALYAGAGAPVPSSANLAAYQLRQWGVSGGPEADGTLRVRASILNGAAQLEAFPLLRVKLANRFGTGIGARDFEPSEYLGKPTARYMNPGEQVDATMDILDPGKNAEGFEIDVCLRGADRKISCANDAVPAQSKR